MCFVPSMYVRLILCAHHTHTHTSNTSSYKSPNVIRRPCSTLFSTPFSVPQSSGPYSSRLLHVVFHSFFFPSTSSLAFKNSAFTCLANNNKIGTNASGTAQFIQSGVPNAGLSPVNNCTIPFAFVPKKVHTIAKGMPVIKHDAMIFVSEMSIAPRLKFLMYRGIEMLRNTNREVNPPR